MATNGEAAGQGLAQPQARRPGLGAARALVRPIPGDHVGQRPRAAQQPGGFRRDPIALAGEDQRMGGRESRTVDGASAEANHFAAEARRRRPAGGNRRFTVPRPQRQDDRRRRLLGRGGRGHGAARPRVSRRVAAGRGADRDLAPAQWRGRSSGDSQDLDSERLAVEQGGWKSQAESVAAIAAAFLRQVRAPDVGQGLGHHLSGADGDHVHPAVRPKRIQGPAADLAGDAAIDETLDTWTPRPGEDPPPQGPQAAKEARRTVGHPGAHAACRRVVARASNPSRLSSSRSHPNASCSRRSAAETSPRRRPASSTRRSS